MAVNEGKDDLVRALLAFCNNEGSLWRALEGSAGVQLIKFLVGLSPERQQECAVALLCLLSNESDESKWAITVAGGIPPLVQVLETGSTKAKEDSQKILPNLCNHSETIRACVESANAVPGQSSLLKNGSPNGKEIAAKTLNHLTHKSDTTTINHKEDSSMWICALLLAVLFRDRDIIRTHATMKSVPVVANLLKSEKLANRYFAAQSIASLVCNGSRGTLLFVAKSGAASGLISLLGCADIYIQDFLGLSEEFSLVRYPDQVALERLFRLDDIRVGATSLEAIPALIDLLKPIPDRPGAPFLALGLLTQLARDCLSNKIVMVEYGALEAVTEYLSLSPQDANEEAATDLLGILFDNAKIHRYEAAFGAITPLVTVLRLGGRGARYSAARALENLFGDARIRSSVAAKSCVKPLVSLLVSEFSPSQHYVVRALDRLLDDEQLAKLVAAHGAIIPLVGLLYGRNYLLHDAISRALVKLGKDRPACKMEMVEAGVIERLLDILHEAPDYLCAAFAKLLLILTNNVSIAKGQSASKVVEPLFLLLTRQEFGPDGQHSALQVLVNILEHPQCRAYYTLTTLQAIEPLIPLLGSPIPAVQQLAAELLSHMFQNESLARTSDAISACRALVKVLEDQPTEEMKVVAICALQNLVMHSRSNQRAVAEDGGVQVVLDLIDSSDPETSVQAAMFIKLLFSNDTIQEYGSSQAVRAMTGEFFFAAYAIYTAC